jgi:hypothetical protein
MFSRFFARAITAGLPGFTGMGLTDRKPLRMWFRIVVLLVALGTVGCRGSSSMPRSLVAPSVDAAPTVNASPTVNTPPLVRSLSPNIGSTGGATGVKIDGAMLGTTVTFDGVPVQGKFFSGNPTMYLSTPAHTAGSVDVVVSGQGGGSVTLSNAFTYASPLIFDFNADWTSFGQTDQEGLVSFAIRDNLLLSVSCGPDVTLTFSPPRPVTNGEFSFVGDDGVGFSGRIVAASEATGTIKLGPCESSGWHARKQ